MPRVGPSALADRWPYDPLVLLLREALTSEAREFGEYRIIELISNESEYGEDDKARLRLTLARILPGRGLFNRLAASMLK